MEENEFREEEENEPAFGIYGGNADAFGRGI